MSSDMKIGEKLKQIRKSKGMSQEQLAAILNVNRNYLSRIENGKSEPTSGVLKRIAQIFNIDLNSLLDTHEDITESKDKIKYITDSCKHLHPKDLDFIIRIISIMREEYVKININNN